MPTRPFAVVLVSLAALLLCAPDAHAVELVARSVQGAEALAVPAADSVRRTRGNALVASPLRRAVTAPAALPEDLATPADDADASAPDDAVRRALSAQVPRVRACYERALKAEPALAGRLLLRFVVERDGSTSGVAVLADQLGAEAVSACVVEQVAAFAFGAQPTSLEIELPFNFRAAP